MSNLADLATAARITELEEENEFLKKHLDICVDEEIESLNAEAEAFDRDCWNMIRQLCEENGLDWKDYPDGLTAHDAYEYLSECFRAADTIITNLHLEMKEELKNYGN